MRAFHHQDFLPLAHVIQEKDCQGLKVSLVVPALNESATIGAIIESASRHLSGTTPLLDEILVIDGGSSDDTAGIAAKAGARVVSADEIGPRVAAPAGKGTSMWKALFVAKGDIVVFADADIREFGPHFVYGLVAPLILYPDITWAKAAYQRPFEWQGHQLDGYGGRVTEILVRPLLSAWYPELVEVRQPLSGEYAVRRAVLRSMPFSSGYGVEILLLLHLYRDYGLSSLAQVDMGIRHHRNRPVRELGAMAHAVLRTFLRFLRDEGRLTSDREFPDKFIDSAGSCADAEIATECMLPPVDSIGC